jgi:hypothetical protein
MFFSRAFISLSSAAIVSTYFAGLASDAELRGDAGLAAADGASGTAFLSKQASLAAESDIDLHSGVCAVAIWVSAHIAASTTKNLIINSFTGLFNQAMNNRGPKGNCNSPSQIKAFQIFWAKCTDSRSMSIADLRRENDRA